MRQVDPGVSLNPGGDHLPRGDLARMGGAKAHPLPHEFRRHPAMLGEHLLNPHRHQRAGAWQKMGIIIDKHRLELMVTHHRHPPIPRQVITDDRIPPQGYAPAVMG